MSVWSRFEKFIYYEPNTGCWLWGGAISNSYGHGSIRRTGAGNGNMLAHRSAYELYVGPIPEGMIVCHSCDVPSCVNPDHLWLGTHADNSRDMKEKGRAARLKGSEKTQAKLTEDDVCKIRNDDRSCHQIAKDYGVSFSLISAIKLRKRWTHVK